MHHVSQILNARDECQRQFMPRTRKDVPRPRLAATCQHAMMERRSLLPVMQEHPHTHTLPDVESGGGHTYSSLRP
jgi:hypothetical protein